MDQMYEKYFVSQVDYNKKFDYDKIAIWGS